MEEIEVMEDRPVQKQNRIQNFDYSQNGVYFITICTENRKCLLSRIIPPTTTTATNVPAVFTVPTVGGGVLDAPQVLLTDFGRVVDHRIRQMNAVYSEIRAEKYVIMPNHIHLLLTIDRGVVVTSGTSRTPSPTNALIPRYVSTLKRMCNKVFGQNIWQRSFHDHVIREERDYQMIWQYIDANPALWEKDCFYTEE